MKIDVVVVRPEEFREIPPTVVGIVKSTDQLVILPGDTLVNPEGNDKHFPSVVLSSKYGNNSAECSVKMVPISAFHNES